MAIRELTFKPTLAEDENVVAKDLLKKVYDDEQLGRSAKYLASRAMWDAMARVRTRRCGHHGVDISLHVDVDKIEFIFPDGFQHDVPVNKRILDQWSAARARDIWERWFTKAENAWIAQKKPDS